MSTPPRDHAYPHAGLKQANQRRSSTASAATCARVDHALKTLGDNVPPHLAAAGRLRLAHPSATLAELGQLADVSKHVVASRLRRLLAMADTQPSQNPLKDDRHG